MPRKVRGCGRWWVDGGTRVRLELEGGRGVGMASGVKWVARRREVQRISFWFWFCWFAVMGDLDFS